MKKYEEYQESSDPKLGSVPASWRITALKRVTEFKYGDALQGEIRNDEGSVNVYGSNGIVGKHDHAITQAPCIIIGRKGSYGKVNYSEEPCFPIDTAYFIDKTTTTNELRYVYYLVQTCELDINSRDSAVPGLSREEAYNKTVALPPLPEQRAIAAYLDHKTSQLDTLLAQKETLLRLLHQKRQALINEAVTQGLDPATPRKPSGVAWLGEVPAHWNILQIKRLCKIKRGASPRPIDDDKYFDDEGQFSWVRISDVTASDKYLLSTEQRLSELGASLSVKRYPGDLILSIAGSVGKPVIAKIDCCIHDGFVCFDDLTCNSDYLYYIFLGGLSFLGLGKLGTQLNLNIDTVGNVYMGLPPKEEQQAIVDFIETKTSKINEATAAIHTQIQTLKAYRQSLISEVVTGKADVRTEVYALLGTAPTPPSKQQASRAALQRPAATGQLGLF